MVVETFQWGNAENNHHVVLDVVSDCNNNNIIITGIERGVATRKRGNSYRINIRQSMFR